MQTVIGRHWHHLPSGEVATLLESDPQTGLDTFELKHQPARFGPNVLTPRKGRSPLVSFLVVEAEMLMVRKRREK